MDSISIQEDKLPKQPGAERKLIVRLAVPIYPISFKFFYQENSLLLNQ